MNFNNQHGVALCQGDIATLFINSFDNHGVKQSVLIKTPRETIDSDLMQREAEILRALKQKLPPHTFGSFIPQVFSSQWCKSKSVQVNVLEMFHGFFDVEAIRMLRPEGVDPRDIVWMWKRLMGLLTWVHSIKHIHGAILPSHVMYFPDNDRRLRGDIRTHSLRLVDWCYAVDYRGQKLAAWCPQYGEFYPDEVLHKKAVGPTTDLYMAAKTMVYLAGGDVKTNQFPAGFPKPISMVLKRCMISSPTLRTSSAKEAFDAMNVAAQAAFGDPQFHEFLLPGI